MVTKKIRAVSVDLLIKVFGTFDENVKTICQFFDVRAVIFEGQTALCGEEKNVDGALAVIDKLIEQAESGGDIDVGRVKYFCECEKENVLGDVDELMRDNVAITHRGSPVKSKTLGQKKYVDAINDNTITFGVGPAGTGKTYLAVAIAVNHLKAHKVERIVLTRPAVEAGEKLGFLPGDLQEKVNPYLRPLYDALQEMLGMEGFAKYLEKGVIEIAPLAYMRGRTLNNAFIILDEAQNTTKEQIKMFLTRLGENSKMVITGDLTQIDLPEGKTSGLKHAVKVLKDVDDIAVRRFNEKDVVRHPLVQLIVKAYENAEEKHNDKTNK